jgi:hypothetical protein
MSGTLPTSKNTLGPIVVPSVVPGGPLVVAGVPVVSSGTWVVEEVLLVVVPGSPPEELPSSASGGAVEPQASKSDAAHIADERSSHAYALDTHRMLPLYTRAEASRQPRVVRVESRLGR